jgi:hypothetical protein
LFEQQQQQQQQQQQHIPNAGVPAVRVLTPRQVMPPNRSALAVVVG